MNALKDTLQSSTWHLKIMFFSFEMGKEVWKAQLILVANATNGVSVKFSNWEEFFPIEYV